jgi:homopolymeric O-antigen transport system permease protein
MNGDKAEVLATVPASAKSTRIRQPLMVLEARSGWAALNLPELWHYRDLLMMLVAREVKLRYKQTFLGVAWVVLQPLVAAAIFALVFGRFARLPSDGHSYLLFVFCGLVVWNYFSGALQRASGSLVGNAQLVAKVYFPRMLIPFANTLAVAVDFLVMFLVLLGLMAMHRVGPTWGILTVPFILLLITICAGGVTMWLSALSVKYRDFMYAVPFLVQVWMFASPVVYAASLIPTKWQPIYSLNPAVGFIEMFRWAMLGRSTIELKGACLAVIVSLGFFFSGAYFFRRVEREFADVI